MTVARSPRRAPRLLIGALAATALVAACGGSSGTHHAANTTTTSSTTTTVPATGGSTTPTADCSTPTLAARSVLAGWAARDRASAGTCSTANTVNVLFAYPGTAAGSMLQGCGGPDPGVPVCTFTYSGGVGRFTLQGTEAAGWSVQEVVLAKS